MATGCLPPAAGVPGACPGFCEAAGALGAVELFALPLAARSGAAVFCRSAAFAGAPLPGASEAEGVGGAGVGRLKGTLLMLAMRVSEATSRWRDRKSVV